MEAATIGPDLKVTFIQHNSHNSHISHKATIPTQLPQPPQFPQPAQPPTSFITIFLFFSGCFGCFKAFLIQYFFGAIFSSRKFYQEKGVLAWHNIKSNRKKPYCLMCYFLFETKGRCGRCSILWFTRKLRCKQFRESD